MVSEDGMDGVYRAEKRGAPYGRATQAARAASETRRWWEWRAPEQTNDHETAVKVEKQTKGLVAIGRVWYHGPKITQKSTKEEDDSRAGNEAS